MSTSEGEHLRRRPETNRPGLSFTAFVFLWRVLAMRDLLVVAGIIVVLVLLLAVFVEPAQTGRMRFRGCVHPFPLGMTAGRGTSGTSQTRQAEPGHGPSGPAGHAGRAEDAVQRDNPALVCLALVGGTALLAGGVWVDKCIRPGGARSPRAAQASRQKSPARMGQRSPGPSALPGRRPGPR